MAYYRNWSDVVGAGSCGFTQTGYLRLEPAGAEAALRARVSRDRSLGWESTIVEPADVFRLAPYVQVDDVALAAYEPGAGYASGRDTTRGFVERAVQLGADVQTGLEVVGLIELGGRITGVRTTSGSIDATIVVIAAGARSAALLQSVGLSLPVVPVLTRTAAFAWPTGRGPDLTHVGDVINGSYLRPDGPDRVVMGVSNLARAPLPDRAADYNEIADDYIQACWARLIARIPSAAEATQDGGLGGPIGLSPDALPIIDAHPAIDGLFFAAADVGSSFKTAPAVGRALADWATSGTCDPSIAALGFSRFASVKSRADLMNVHDDYFSFGGVLP
jgi:sarcosine oxidase subunit beta